MGAHSPIAVNGHPIPLVVHPLVLGDIGEFLAGESDLGVGSVAERLVRRLTTASERHRRFCRQRTLGIAQVRHILDEIGAVEARRDAGVGIIRI